jgi:hypothetical protein
MTSRRFAVVEVDHSIESPAPGSELVRECLKSLPKDERKAIGEDIAYFQWSRLGGSGVAGRSYRADTLRGRGPADGAASWVYQENTADTV